MVKPLTRAAPSSARATLCRENSATGFKRSPTRFSKLQGIFEDGTRLFETSGPPPGKRTFVSANYGIAGIAMAFNFSD
jgi:hypothetical protein